jgi:hypothetical protein
MNRKIQGSTRLATAALGVLGLSLAVAAPLPAAGAQDVDRGPVVTASSTAAATPAATRTASTAAQKYSWGRVVAGDEFNYRGKPSSKKWSVYSSKGHNNRGQRRPSAWNVNGSAATVTGTSNGTTGGMSSRYNQKYGRWEVRMKTNTRDPQYHPNLMLWPNGRSSRCAEVDFAESTHEASKIKFFLHYGCKPLQSTANRTLDMRKWHTYAVQWTPSGITGYVDGAVFFRDTNRSHLPSGSMHASTQLDWFPRGKSPRTSSMTIDWVRIYKR